MPANEQYIVEVISAPEIKDFLKAQPTKDFFEKVDWDRLSIWARPWFIWAAADNRSVILVFKDINNSLIALLPLTLESSVFSKLYRGHRFDLFPEEIDFIYKNRNEGLVTALADWLRSNRSILDLDGIRKDALIADLLNKDLYLKSDPTDSSRVFYEFGTYDDFLKKSSRNLRSSLNRASKKLDELGIEFHQFHEVEENWLEVFFQLHSEQFGEKSELIMRRESFEQILHQASTQNCLRVMSARIGDELIAIDIWFAQNSQWFLINGGRKTDKIYTNLSNLMIVNGLVDAFSNGATRVSLMRPDSQYKQRLGGESLELMRLRCAKTKSSWIMYRLVTEIKKLLHN